MPFCYVHPSKAKLFEEEVKSHLGKYCILFKSEELVKRGWFGLGDINSKLLDRIGDYILVMKENYRLKDNMMNDKKKKEMIGHHGGLTKEEMLVPLIVLNQIKDYFQATVI